MKLALRSDGGSSTYPADSTALTDETTRPASSVAAMTHCELEESP
jgi:hypothetical protein